MKQKASTYEQAILNGQPTIYDNIILMKQFRYQHIPRNAHSTPRCSLRAGHK